MSKLYADFWDSEKLWPNKDRHGKLWPPRTILLLVKSGVLESEVAHTFHARHIPKLTVFNIKKMEARRCPHRRPTRVSLPKCTYLSAHKFSKYSIILTDSGPLPQVAKRFEDKVDKHDNFHCYQKSLRQGCIRLFKKRK